MKLINKLSEIAKSAFAEKQADLARAKKDLPAMFVEKNIDNLKGALLDAAKDGKRNIDISHSGPDYKRNWVAVRDGNYEILDIYNPIFGEEVVIKFNKILYSDGLVMKKKKFWGTGRNKNLSYDQWTISW